MSIERSLNIHIGTTSDTKGVNEVKESVEGAKNSFVQLGEKIAENTEGTGKLEGAHHKLREGINIIAENVAPGMGGALIAALEGPIGWALAAGIAFTKLNEIISETNKKLDETGASLAERFGNMAEAIEDAARKQIYANNEVTRSIKEIEEAEKRYTQQVEESTAAIHRKEQAQVALTDALEAEQLAEVEAARKLGMSEVDADKLERQIKATAEARRNQVANAADTGAANAKSTELDNALLNQSRLQKIVADGDANKINREAKLSEKGLPAELAGLDKAKEEFTKAVLDQQQAVDSAQAASDRLKKAHANFGFGTDADLAASQGNADAAKQKLKDIEDAARQNEEAIKAKENEKAKLELEQSNYEKAKDALDKIKDTIGEIRRQAESLWTVAKENSQQRSQLAGIHAETELVRGLPAIMTSASGVANASNQSLAALHALLQAVISNQQTTTQALSGAHNNIENQQTQIDQLYQAITQLGMALKYSQLNHIGP